MKRDVERSRRVRMESRDFSLPANGPEKTERIDLGLALLSLHAMPGVCYTFDEIAVWCGCTNAAIQRIETAALLKVRNALRVRDRRLWEDLRTEFWDRSSPVRPNERMAA